MRNKLWAGGYITDDGVYFIRKMISGHRFHISTRCTNKEAALGHYRTFQNDPGAYSPVGTARTDDVELTAAMIQEHFEWTSQLLTRETALTYRKYLHQWALHFRGRDLRQLQLVADIKSHLAGLRGVPHRIKALKSLYQWLIEEKGLVEASQNPTLALKVKRGRAKQSTEKMYVEREHFTAVLAHLQPEFLDIFIVLGATGIHLTELQRFAKVGKLIPRRDTDPPDVFGILAVEQLKSGQLHVVNLVDRVHYEAAGRIKARGHVPDRGWVLKQLQRAIQKANKPRPHHDKINFTTKQMRHSVTTWLVKAGLSVETAGRYIGHLDPRTTRKHYADHFVSAVTLDPRHLRVLNGGSSNDFQRRGEEAG